VTTTEAGTKPHRESNDEGGTPAGIPPSFLDIPLPSGEGWGGDRLRTADADYLCGLFGVCLFGLTSV
jgi:hypothetical protein